MNDPRLPTHRSAKHGHVPVAEFSLLRVLALAPIATVACGPGTSTIDDASGGEAGSVSDTSTSAETTSETTGEAAIEGWPELWLGYYYQPFLQLDVAVNAITHLDNVELRNEEIMWEHITCRAAVTEQAVPILYEKNRVEFTIATPYVLPREEYHIVLRPPEDGDCSKLLMVLTSSEGETLSDTTLMRGRQYVFDTCDDDTDWGPSLNSDVPTTCEL